MYIGNIVSLKTRGSSDGNFIYFNIMCVNNISYIAVEGSFNLNFIKRCENMINLISNYIDSIRQYTILNQSNHIILDNSPLRVEHQF